jgi:hypothetical protein
MASRILPLGRDDCCARCAIRLEAGTRAFWDAERKTVTCTPCLAGTSEQAELDRGRPRGERRARARTAQAQTSDGEETDDAPWHERSYLLGAQGEEAVAQTLEARTEGYPVVLLHDRRMPGGRGNIDHLAIAPTGVFVIDAKHWSGKVEVTPARPGPRKLLINRSDQTRLVDGLHRQVAAVRAALTTTTPTPPVHGVLCFTKAQLPSKGTLTFDGHHLLPRRATTNRLRKGGPTSLAQIQAIAQTLGLAFPGALGTTLTAPTSRPLRDWVLLPRLGGRPTRARHR